MVEVKSESNPVLKARAHLIADRLPNPKLQFLILLSILLLAMAARLYGLADKPLWYDEVLTLWRANLPLPQLIADSFNNKHHPLYFLAVQPFASSPWSEAFLRLPSAVFGATCALLVGAIALRLGGSCAGFVAGILMALSPCEVQYGQEARSYTLTSAAVLLSLWGLVRLTDQIPPATGTTIRCRALVGPWLAYAVGMTVALNTLSVAAPWFVAANIAVAIIICAHGRYNGPVRTWAFVNLAVLATWLPGVIMITVANHDDPLRGLQWIPAPSLEHVSQVLAGLYMLRISDHTTLELMPPVVPYLGLAIVAFAVAGGISLIRRPAVAAILLTATLTMPLAMAILSIFHPVFVPRYLLWSTGPYFILVGVGVGMLPRLWRVAAMTALAVGAAVSLLPYYNSETKPRWDVVATYLRDNVQSGDGLITSDGLSRMVLEAYATRDGGPTPAFLRLESLDEIVNKFESGRTVWVIHGRAGQGPREPEATFFARWAMFGTPTKQRAFGKHIRLVRYNKRILPH